MTQQTTAADAELKAKHRAMWAFGDYDDVAARIIPDLGQAVADACRIQPGERVLDIAAGSGNAAIPAALAGGNVVATDLTPELLETGRRHAAGANVELTWQEADAEALPFADGEFDVAMSCVGIMFAPHHQASADELVRVVRPGGRIGLVNWTPEGFIGQMFATMKPYAPPPPPGAQPPPLWGKEEHVRELLGDRVTDVVAARQDRHHRPVRQRRGVPRLLQGRLRPDHRGLQVAGRPARAGRRPRPGARRPGRPGQRGRRHHAVGVPAPHRPPRLTRQQTATLDPSVSF